jgi:hypothetical protein
MCQADFLLKFLILELSTATDLADKAGKARIFQNSPLPACRSSQKGLKMPVNIRVL